jgi:aspartate racemase
MSSEDREIWGVLGGMGPLASAEFVRTVYEETVSGPEQNCPIVVSISDPTIPDRTEYLLSGREDILLEIFSKNIGQLISMGATKIVVACFTIHPLISRLPEAGRKRIVSLVDLALEAAAESEDKHLLICSNGSRKVRLFERHPLWEKAKDAIILPDSGDQDQLHDMIYEIKTNVQCIRHVNFVESLLAKYGVNTYIAGCSEIHIFAKYHERASGRNRRDFCIDPLTLVLSLMSPEPQSQPARAI